MRPRCGKVLKALTIVVMTGIFLCQVSGSLCPMTDEAFALTFAVKQGHGHHNMFRMSMCQEALPSFSPQESADLTAWDQPVVLMASSVVDLDPCSLLDPPSPVVHARSGPPLYTFLSTFRI